MRFGLGGALSASIAIALATPASAATTLYEFSGVITSQIGAIEIDGFRSHVGEKFSGTVLFDPEKQFEDSSSVVDSISPISVGDSLVIDTPGDKAASSVYNGKRYLYILPFNPVVFTSQGKSYQCAGSGNVTITGPSTMSFGLGCVAGNARIEGSGSYKVAGSTSAVPEIGTWAMMILGFGIIGYSMRRKTVLRFV